MSLANVPPAVRSATAGSTIVPSATRTALFNRINEWLDTMAQEGKLQESDPRNSPKFVTSGDILALVSEVYSICKEALL